MRDAFKRGTALLVLLTFFGNLTDLHARRRKRIRRRRPRIERTLATLDNRTADSSVTQDGVIVRARRLTPRDCKQYLKIRKLYNPVQLTIENYSNKSWVIEDKGIGLNLINYKKISAKLHARRINGFFGRLIFGFGAVAGLTLGALPAAIEISALLASFAASEGVILTAGIGTSAVMLSLAFQSAALTPWHTFAYIKSSAYTHGKILKYTFDNRVILHPGERVNMLVFVRNKEKRKFKKFSVTVFNHDNPEEQLTFNSAVLVKTRKY